MKKTARIDNWVLWTNPKGDQQLIGTVSAHDRQDEFRSDTQITSRIVKIDFEAGTAETLNTLYTLGTKAHEALAA